MMGLASEAVPGSGSPLVGICVVSLEQAVAAPLATRHLGDMGARVIKVERPVTGDFARSYDDKVKGLSANFVWLNRSKESLTLDLKHEAAPAILERLLNRADVFVQNLAPGAAARLGLSPSRLQGKYPRLIVCDISGYGSNGPYSLKKAYDLLIQCETGLVSITGTQDSPSKVGISVADIAAGMYAFSGVLTALYAREKTGKGCAFEVSLFDALGEWMSYPAYLAAYGGADPPRTGASHAAIYPYGPFGTGDGETIFFGIQNEREWHSFCDSVLQRPELVHNPDFADNTARSEHRGALKEIIEGCFASLGAAQVLGRLEKARIANARLNTARQFWDHPQLRARGRLREVDSPVGSLRAMLPPITFGGTAPCMGGVPALGQHTRSVLAELGYGPDAIARLAAQGAI